MGIRNPSWIVSAGAGCSRTSDWVFLGGSNEVGWFFGKKKREDKRKKRSILSVLFLHKHKNCVRDFCVISTVHIHMFLLWTSSSAPHFSHYTTTPPPFQKKKKNTQKKASNSQESSEIAIHPLLHRSIQRIQRHHKAHDDLQADLRPHPRLLSPRLRRWGEKFAFKSQKKKSPLFQGQGGPHISYISQLLVINGWKQV